MDWVSKLGYYPVVAGYFPFFMTMVCLKVGACVAGSTIAILSKAIVVGVR
jgi:hypothetical protein